MGKATEIFFRKYPQYNNLRSLVSDKLIIEEIGSRADEFEKIYKKAQKRIKTVKLSDIFPSTLEKGSIILENFLGHWGNISVEEVCKIALITKFLKPKRIFEFGTYNGMTTLQLALNVPKGCRVYTLDLPDDTSPQIPLSKIDALVAKHFKNKFGTKIGSYFKNRKDIKIIQILQDGATFDPSPFKNAMDLIFIDAAHDYKNKKKDSENAFFMLRRGGVVIWHNYADVGCPDVTKYLYQLSMSKKIYHLKNTLFAIYI